MLDTLNLLRQLILAPGPPGQEELVADIVENYSKELTCPVSRDARGNVVIGLPGDLEAPHEAEIVVAAHLDEIALMVESAEPDGKLKVAPMGGLLPWKWGEGPVSLLASSGEIPGILGFGSIHTNSMESAAVRAREKPLSWDSARVFTGLSVHSLNEKGVRPGTRVVLGRDRRFITEFGDFIAAPFLDDRADLAAMILALEIIKERGTADGNVKRRSVAFAATAAEEVGGHGALSLFRRLKPEIVIALEIGPRVPESPFALDAKPTVWVNDGYSAMQAKDINLMAKVVSESGIDVHWQALSRGGSDASCAASHGLVDRPFTLAFAAENSHGYEITHKNSIGNLARLVVALVENLASA
jgi:putative aminopeptidase FrvX